MDNILNSFWDKYHLKRLSSCVYTHLQTQTEYQE